MNLFQTILLFHATKGLSVRTNRCYSCSGTFLFSSRKFRPNSNLIQKRVTKREPLSLDQAVSSLSQTRSFPAPDFAWTRWASTGRLMAAKSSSWIVSVLEKLVKNLPACQEKLLEANTKTARSTAMEMHAIMIWALEWSANRKLLRSDRVLSAQLLKEKEKTTIAKILKISNHKNVRLIFQKDALQVHYSHKSFNLSYFSIFCAKHT